MKVSIKKTPCVEYWMRKHEYTKNGETLSIVFYAGNHTRNIWLGRKRLSNEQAVECLRAWRK